MITTYIVVFTILAVLSASEVAVDDDRLRRAFPFVVFALVLFSGLRGEGVGFDYAVYREMFAAAATGGELFIEPAFATVMRLVGGVLGAGAFQFLLVAMAAAAIGTKSWFTARWSPGIYTGLLIYYSTAMLINDMGQIRYGLAVALCLVGFHHMILGRRGWAWAICLLALTFHFSAAFVLPALLLVDRQISGRTMFVVSLAATIFYLVSINDVLLLLSRVIPVPYIVDKLEFYTYATDTFGQSLGVNLSVLLRATILAASWHYREALSTIIPPIRGFINLYFYGFVLYMVFSSNAEFATRGTGYFKILEVAITPTLISLGRTTADRFLIWAAVLSYALYSIFKVLAEDFGEPYWNYYNILF